MRSISISEIKRFKCRLRWYWSSAPPRGLGLIPLRGESEDLSFGRIIHKTLQRGYDADRDFVKAYKEVREEHGTLGKFDGKAIIAHYQKWSEQADKAYRFLATESEWKGIEVPGTKGTLSAVIDAVVERHDGLWIMDFKTTKYRNNPWTTQDLQATAYVYAARKLISPDIRGLIFRFIRKSAPWGADRLILKSGRVTKRSKLPGITTYAEYYNALAIATIRSMDLDWEGDDESTLLEYQDDPDFKEKFLSVRRMHFDQLQSFKDVGNSFVWEVPEHRTEKQIENYLRYFIAPRMNEILNVKWIGPTGLDIAYAACGRCPFKGPCRLVMDGADYRTILREDYEMSPRYREELENETSNNNATK